MEVVAARDSGCELFDEFLTKAAGGMVKVTKVFQPDIDSSLVKDPPTEHSKFWHSVDHAVSDIQPGVVVLSAGFGLCGTPETIIQALRRRGNGQLHSLTVVSNNIGAAKGGGLSPLVNDGQVTRAICSFIGNNKSLEKRYFSGELAIEITPQGTLAEKIRCGGAGIPAFYTRTGVSTHIQTGEIPVKFNNGQVIETSKPRETRIFDNQIYNMETAITGDVAIVHAWKADLQGNCKFRHTTKSFGMIMAKAAKLTIVEAEHIVPVGELEPDQVDLPGIFVHRIVQATEEKRIEVMKLRDSDSNHLHAGADDCLSRQKRSLIARRAAKELTAGSYVNLGIGLPTLVAEYITPSSNIWIQSENGLMGMGPHPSKEEVDCDIVNAGKETVTLVKGASTFDSSESFGMIRGGHIDVAMLGAFQVAANGDMANYMVPGKVIKGMGGAMDLVSNPQQTKIVALINHVDKNGMSKVVQNCSLPLTGSKVVSTIITDLCVFEVDRDRGGLTLTELAPAVTIEEVKHKTDAKFEVAIFVTQMV